jgi:3-oxoacyl-[acyl-carrier-protein] synthase-3
VNCYLTGFGASLPAREITNAELAPQLGVTPEWIETNSGIRTRRWVAPEQSVSTLATEALQAALRDAKLKEAQLDYLIGGTLSPDYQVPGIAPLVQRRLADCRAIPALDIRQGCARFCIASNSRKDCWPAARRNTSLALEPKHNRKA